MKQICENINPARLAEQDVLSDNLRIEIDDLRKFRRVESRSSYPVSYTHLDVYKRHAHICRLHLFFDSALRIYRNAFPKLSLIHI